MSHRHDIERRAKELMAALAGSDLRFATAESCTGGQLSALLAGDAELGPHLERGFTAYSLDAKCELLGVDRSDAERCDAVNPEVAEAMAKGALAGSRADIAIAITGFCGPQQEKEEVGLVYLACIDTGGRCIAQECHFGDLGRQQVLDHAVTAALAMMTDTARNLRQGLQSVSTLEAATPDRSR